MATTSAGAAVSPPERDKFYHPYTPYDVQLQFMRVAYDILSHGDGQIGILESPTGTGKSLSLICSALSWLRSYKKQQHESAIFAVEEGMKDEPAWLVEQMLRRKREELVQQWRDREERHAKIRAHERNLEVRGKKRRRLEETRSKRGSGEVDEDAEFLLEDWSDTGTGDDAMSLFSQETRALMERVGLGPSKKQEEETEEDEGIKIFYTSRTHSQLSQFVSELRRPSFPSSIPGAKPHAKGPDEMTEAVKHIPLSSRQRLCINPSVSRLGSLSAINDRCAELQQPKTKEKCPYVPNAENLSSTYRFRDEALATVPDIEDMFQLGKTLQVCPYYASRTAIPGAEIVTLPYPLLLQKSARDALGIKVEGNVVIIDEAHNIMDAISSVYAAEITLSELRKARQLLRVYVGRFGKKLKGENRVMVAQVGRVVEALSEWLDSAFKSKIAQGIVDPNLLLKAKGADQLNLFQLVKYIQQSKLAYKVESYASHIEDSVASSGHATSTPPVLHNLVSFLTALTHLSSEGRIFYEKVTTPPDIKLAYLLLSPTHAFSSIASSARAVILAGGTMSPFDDYVSHLFPSLPPGKITTLSCGHVIPPSNLCVWSLASMRSTGATGNPSPAIFGSDAFEFSFQKRGDKTMIRQLGLVVLNICTIVPDGVIVFFPSYGYLDQVVTVWQSLETDGGQGASLWSRLQGKKALFRDMKGASSEEILQQYSSAILGGDEQPENAAPSTRRGALLLSVVGGRMSEGINFSDRLGRCVIVVGLPYPNINSPEWKAKIEYIESSTLERLSPSSEVKEETPDRPTISREEAIAQSKQAARDFYENACMRAVNQSIGRAIRHQKDYAAIVLIDRRFGTERIRKKLPGWIRGGMEVGSEEQGLPGLMGALSTFFRAKREQP